MERDWRDFKMAKSALKKWEAFLWIYKEGAERHVPNVVVKELKKNECFNTRCGLARRKRKEAWDRWRRKEGNGNNMRKH